MHAILILGGKSRRFWPLEEKPLFEICGKSLLAHQIERLREGGVEQISLVVSEDNRVDIQALYPDLEIITQDPGLSGMRGAVLSALNTIDLSDPILIVSGNDVMDPVAYKDLLCSGGDGAILAKEVETYFPGGYLSVEGDCVTDIAEKPGEGNEPSNLINLVAHVHRDPTSLKKVLEEVSNDADDGYEQALSSLFKTKKYRAVPYVGPWHPVKYPWHLLPLLEQLLGSIQESVIHSSADIHETAVINGPVVIEEGVRVFPHATIQGPCRIGKNSIVANNALVRNADVGEGVTVGYNTEIARSVLCKNVQTHLTYIGDSVIGEGTSFGGGSVTGNLRLDHTPVPSVVDDQKIQTHLPKLGVITGKNCQLGIQTGTAPGIKIGAGTFIASGGLQITQDIPEGKFVRMKDGVLEMKENRVGKSFDTPTCHPE